MEKSDNYLQKKKTKTEESNPPQLCQIFVIPTFLKILFENIFGHLSGKKKKHERKEPFLSPHVPCKANKQHSKKNTGIAGIE